MELTPNASTSGSSLQFGGKSKKKSLGEGLGQETMQKPEAGAVCLLPSGCPVTESGEGKGWLT